MSVVCLTIGDPHIRTKEVEYTDLMLEEIVEIAQEIEPDFIVVLGDTLHTHDNIRGGPLSRAIRFLEKLRKISFLVLLIGNHDLRNNQVFLTDEPNPEHPFTALHHWENTLVCDVPKVFEIAGMSFCGVPFFPVGQYHEGIREIDVPEIRAFFSHQEFRGVRYHLSGDPSEDGDVWPEDYPLNICGHIHEAQELAKNLIYVGTPVQQDFGASPDKGVGIFNFQQLSSGEFTYTYDRRRLLKPPTRVQYYIPGQDGQRLNELLKELQEIDADPDVFQLTKIRLTGNPSELHAVSKSPIIKALKELDNVTVVNNPTEWNSTTLASSSKTTEGSTEVRTFDGFVHTMLEADPELKDVYASLFGALKKSTSVKTQKKRVFKLKTRIKLKK